MPRWVARLLSFPAAVGAAATLLSAGCGGASASYAAVVGACEAAESAVEAACDPGEDTVCRGEMTNEQANAQIDCVRATCDLVQQAIEADAP